MLAFFRLNREVNLDIKQKFFVINLCVQMVR